MTDAVSGFLEETGSERAANEEKLKYIVEKIGPYKGRLVALVARDEYVIPADDEFPDCDCFTEEGVVPREIVRYPLTIVEFNNLGYAEGKLVFHGRYVNTSRLLFHARNRFSEGFDDSDCLGDKEPVMFPFPASQIGTDGMLIVPDKNPLLYSNMPYSRDGRRYDAVVGIEKVQQHMGLGTEPRDREEFLKMLFSAQGLDFDALFRISRGLIEFKEAFLDSDAGFEKVDNHTNKALESLCRELFF